MSDEQSDTSALIDVSHHQSDTCGFVVNELARLRGRAIRHADRHLKHILVLPESKTVEIPKRSGLDPIGTMAVEGSRRARPKQFGDSEVFAPLLLKRFWPQDVEHATAIVVGPDPRPQRIHLFFGERSAVNVLATIAAQLAGLDEDIRRAVFGDRPLRPSVLFLARESDLKRSDQAIDMLLVTLPTRPATLETKSTEGASPSLSVDNKDEPDKRLPKEPSKRAKQAWTLREFAGLPQIQIAAKLGCDQGTVSRDLKTMEEWIAAGGPAPEPSPTIRQVQSADPSKLDIGARRDGLTPRQRERRDSDG